MVAGLRIALLAPPAAALPPPPSHAPLHCRLGLLTAPERRHIILQAAYSILPALHALQGPLSERPNFAPRTEQPAAAGSEVERAWRRL